MRAYEFLTEAPTKQQLKYMQRIYAKMQENPAVIDELWNVISTKIADDEGGMQQQQVIQNKKGKKGKVKPAGKCPAGCVPAGMEKKKESNLSKTSFDPALTDKKPKVVGTPQ